MPWSSFKKKPLRLLQISQGTGGGGNHIVIWRGILILELGSKIPDQFLKLQLKILKLSLETQWRLCTFKLKKVNIINDYFDPTV